jgi:DNA-binding Lrp family transcriptional regulator
LEWLVICRIKTLKRAPQDVARQIANLPQCIVAAVVLGSHDVLGYFLVADRAELGEVADNLAAIGGIAELSVDLATETSFNPESRRFFMARSAMPIRFPAPRIDLDDLDLAIMQALIDDGRRSSRTIARKLQVSEGTVRVGTNRLTQSGLIRVMAMVEPVALGIAGVIAAISVRAERARLNSIVNELVAMPEVGLLAKCVGRWDMHITVIAADAQRLMQMVSTRVQCIGGVLETDKLFLADVVRVSPHMKRLESLETVNV